MLGSKLKFHTENCLSIAMNKNKQIFDLYVDHPVTPFRYTIATGLSNLLVWDLSHDQITRVLSHKEFTLADYPAFSFLLLTCGQLKK